MKEVLSLFTFVIGAVCFVVFFAALKPNAVSAVPGTSKPEYCKHGSFAYAHFAARASLPQDRGLTRAAIAKSRPTSIARVATCVALTAG